MKSVILALNNIDAAKGIQEKLKKNFRVDLASDRDTCLELFRRKRYEFTFIDLDFLKGEVETNGRANYKKSLEPFWQAFPNAQIIVLSDQISIRESVAAVKAGASTYLTYPIDSHELEYVLESLCGFQKFEAELAHFREDKWLSNVAEGAKTHCAAMAEVMGQIRLVAPTRTTVLMTGETGSGKGVLARLIHSQSNRSNGPFIAVHCGAIPETLVESEFFGHEKGAFTGAIRRKLGKFQIADGGTLFLDEIGTISLSTQIKMLQVLQEKTFSRVGGEEAIEVDVRLVAATNMDLKKLCRDGLFREDLYFRLNVFSIDVPPLRKRPEDIPMLIDTFLERLNRVYSKDIKGVTPEVLEVLQRYAWPGNIRELENLIERAFILEKGNLLTEESFPAELFSIDTFVEGRQIEELPSLEEVRQRAVKQVEKRYLGEILTLSRGRIDKTAGIAGVTPRQLHNLMNKYGLRKEDYK